MTHRANARIAGFTFLFYIAVAFPAMLLFDKATSGVGIHAKLATIAQHTTEMRVAVLLGVLSSFSALERPKNWVLGATSKGLRHISYSELPYPTLYLRI